MSSSPGAGFEYPSQDVAWLKRDVLLFAHTVGCTVDELHFLYVCLSVLSVCSVCLFCLSAAPLTYAIMIDALQANATHTWQLND